MAAATNIRMTKVREGSYLTVPVGANKKIFGGTIVVLSATGFAEAATLATGKTVVGKASETVDNTGGADGALFITVQTSNGSREFLFANSGTNAVTVAHVGKPVYCEDDQTVGSLATGMSTAGTCAGVSSAGVFVRFPL